MATAQSLEFRWGIISTGEIATKVVKDLLIDPKTRGIHDIVHRIVAVGSRSVDSAQKFIDTVVGGDKSVKAYGSYAEVFSDPSVDAIYIGTPHTLHYASAHAALVVGKHVLCEKPATSNAAELRALIATAKEHKAFFMEAMWTRFQPLTKEIKEVAEDPALGDIVSVHADLSGDFDIQSLPNTHRMMDPALGGGALLDLGPYPMIWAILFLYEHQANARSKPSSVVGLMLKTAQTGVDATTAWVVTFSQGSHFSAQAVLSCSMTVPSTEPGVIARFRGGTILIPGPIYRPLSYTVQYFDKMGSGKVAREVTKSTVYTGFGWHFQADEVARCVRAGKLESDLWGHDKSLLEMETFDEVRRQCGYIFPPGVEQVVDA